MTTKDSKLFNNCTSKPKPVSALLPPNMLQLDQEAIEMLESYSRYLSAGVIDSSVLLKLGAKFHKLYVSQVKGKV